MMTNESMAKTISQQFFQPPFYVSAGDKYWDWEGSFASRKSSTSATEQTYPYTGFGAAVSIADAGENIPMVEMTELGTVTWTHTQYALGFMVPQTLIEDAKYENPAKEGGKMLGESHSYVRDLAVANVANNAFSSSYPVFDSVELCGTHTTSVSGTTVTNYTASLSLNYTNFWTVAKFFLYQRYTEAGLPLPPAKNLTLLFHPYKLDAATLIALNQMEPDNADRNRNTLSDNFTIKLQPCNLLSSTTAWFVYTDDFKNDCIFYDRIKPYVEDNPAISQYGTIFRSRSRFSVKSRNYINIYGTTGA